MTIEPNTVISHYKILSEIGKGGMGEVYLAQDTELDRKVAIKFLSEEFSKDSDKLNRFIQEAKAVSALNHPNIITIHEIGDAEGAQYIALEHIEGETLTTRLRKKLKFNAALDIATQIASALDAAHRAGIVHRDIKPDNVMIRKDGLVKILDFGIAKLTEKSTPEIESEDKTAVQVNTSPGMIIGTANYMSPEQAKGKDVDARTDIFSFGVVLYEMITGRLPFEGESPLEIIGSILNKEPKPIDRTEVPAEVERIISKTLRKDRNERYQTIKDVLIDLKDAKQDLEFQDKLDRTVQPDRDEQNTQMFKATTAAEAQNTTASGISDSITIKKSGLGKAVGGILVVLLVTAIGISYWYLASGNSDAIDSIAVMPFVNESGDKEVEYLTDGMTETLINSLSQIPDLNVKARSLVFRYKDKELNPKQVALDLGVRAILTGRLTQRGNQLTLNVELIDGSSENTIWGNRYVRQVSDLVALQGDLARDVSATIKAKLSSAEAAKVEDTYTTDPEAYQQYLKGRYAWNRRTTVSLKQAADFFKKAIEEDPNYALAYAGLAETYALFIQYDVASAKESMPQTKAAAMRALELDDTLAAPHVALEAYYTYFKFDRAAAEREIRRAIELDPNYATAHQWLGGDVLVNTKRFDEAITALKRAQELDPLSPIIGTNLADAMLFAGRYDDAITQYERVRSFDANFGYLNYGLGLAYWQKGMKQEAIAAAQKYIELSEASLGKGNLGFFLAKSGKRKEAVNILEGLTKESPEQKMPNYPIAIIYLGLGDKEKALDWLEKEVAEFGPQTNFYAINPELEELRDEPRLKAMLKRLGLPE